MIHGATEYGQDEVWAGMDGAHTDIKHPCNLMSTCQSTLVAEYKPDNMQQSEIHLLYVVIVMA